MRRHGPTQPSLRRPHGWQAVSFTTADGCLVVAHGFEPPARPVVIPLPEGSWQSADTLGASPHLREGLLQVRLADGEAAVVHLTRCAASPAQP